MESALILTETFTLVPPNGNIFTHASENTVTFHFKKFRAKDGESSSRARRERESPPPPPHSVSFFPSDLNCRSRNLVSNEGNPAATTANDLARIRDLHWKMQGACEGRPFRKIRFSQRGAVSRERKKLANLRKSPAFPVLPTSRECVTRRLVCVHGENTAVRVTTKFVQSEFLTEIVFLLQNVGQVSLDSWLAHCCELCVNVFYIVHQIESTVLALRRKCVENNRCLFRRY